MTKSRLQRVLVILLAVTAALGLGVYALAGNSSAEPTVVFDAAKAGTGTNPFTINNAAPYTDDGSFAGNTLPDLFQNMKDVMPGDTRTGTITVRVDNAGSDQTVKMYLRAENPNEDYEALMDPAQKVSLSASIDNVVKSPLTVLGQLFSDRANNLSYDGTYPGQDGVVYLGAFDTGSTEKSIDVNLTVPVEFTADDLTASVDWVFVAELIENQDPGGDDDPDGPGGGGDDDPDGPGGGGDDDPDGPGGGGDDDPDGPGGGGDDDPDDPGGGGHHHHGKDDGDGDDDSIYNPDGPQLNTKDHIAYIIGYPKDYVTGEPTEIQYRMPVYPENRINRAEVATIFFRMLTILSRDTYWSSTNPFSDVPSYMWYNNAISTLSNAKLVNGYPEGDFRPDNYITRAEFAAITARFLKPVNRSSNFTDVKGHWAEAYINTAAAVGVINGYPDGTFRPENLITRAEAITMMNRLLGRSPITSGMLPDMLKWPDNKDTSEWYYDQMQEATNSHDYTLRSDGYEQWTELMEAPDWVNLEREWSTANSMKNAALVFESSLK